MTDSTVADDGVPGPASAGKSSMPKPPSRVTTLRAGVVLVVVALAVAVTLGVIHGLGTGASGPSPSGVVATVIAAGGPPMVNGPRLIRGEATLTISADGRPVASRSVENGSSVRVALAPGDYEVTAEFGNAGCIGATVEVKAGQFTPVTVACPQP